jgi:hypothetical protein
MDEVSPIMQVGPTMSAGARRQFHEAVAFFLTAADPFDYDMESTHQTHSTLIQHKLVNDQTRATTDTCTIGEPLMWKGENTVVPPMIPYSF